MSKFGFKKALLFSLLVAALAFVMPLTTRAQGIGASLPLLLGPLGPVIFKAVGTTIGNITGSVIGWIVYVLTYIGATLAGVAISLIAYLIEVVLQLNMQIVNALAVKTGFSIALSLANLGFVIGIIVIAIMTIFRYQPYGMKQILWKLVVMAILVNFSLVIAGTILSFSNQLTLYFLNGINPAGSVGGATNAASSFHNFASSLAGAFAPQRAFLNINTANLTFQAGEQGNYQGTASAAGQTLAGILTPLLNLFFVAFFLVFIVLVLAAFLAMLVIRYVFLGILLVLAPLAWLCWIFPALKRHWDNWWSRFLKWTFFAPLAVFFLYLAILTAGTMGSTQANNPLAAFDAQGYNPSASNPIVHGISGLFGGFLNQTVGTILQMILILGLAVGGLFAANSLSIIGAGAALGAATGIGKWAGGWAARKGLQYGTAPLRRKGVEAGALSRAERVQAWAASRQSGAGRFAAGLMARGTTRLAAVGGEDLVKQATADAAKMNTSDLKSAVLSATMPRRIAYLQELGKRGDLGGVPAALSHSAEMERNFASFGQAANYTKNVETPSGFSSNMYEAQRRGASSEELRRLAEEFARKLTKADVAKMQLNDIFSGKEKFGLSKEALDSLGGALAYGVASAMPALASSMLPRMKAEPLSSFGDQYNRALNGLERDATTDEARRRIQEQRNQFRNSLAYNVVGFTPTPEVGGGATTTGTT